jgi:phage terminase large subunit-like protein
MLGNVALKTNPSGNIKPDKEKSGNKINGIISLIMSIRQRMTDQSKTQNTIPDNYQIRIL